MNALTEEHFVFRGEVQLYDWSESARQGPKIVLWLPDAEGLDKFRDMTKKKGKQAGQRLRVVLAKSETEIVFDGEMQLLSWSDTCSKGATITTQLAEAEKLGPFKPLAVRQGKTEGQALMGVVVELGDVDEPVPQRKPGPPAPKGGALAVLSGQWCQMGRFQDWLRERNYASWQRAMNNLTENGDSTVPSEIAAEVVRILCGVESRAQLDHDTEAAALFHRYIRLPFAAILHEEHE